MKLKSYTLLFRFFSYLSDKTNGTHFFVKYKLLLGTIILGLGSTSCGSKVSPLVTCYDMTVVENDSINTISTDTIEKPNMMITCYDIALPIEPEVETNKPKE